MEKGSKQAIAAGKKAAETRRLNRVLLNKPVKTKSVKLARVSFKKLKESNFHKMTINSPCEIYVHKKLNAIYISNSDTILN